MIITRTDIINRLINTFNYTSYLEIGVQNGINFNQVFCKEKIGVDPDANVKVDYPITSDEFFKKNKKNFDIIFIDGLHECRQVERDLLNSLQVLNKNGSIVCHDMNPQSEIAQRVPREVKVWNGDCWKGLLNVVLYLNIEYYTVDTDHGCTVIRNTPYVPNEKITDYYYLSYKDLDENRKAWLNLISVEEFYNKY